MARRKILLIFSGLFIFSSLFLLRFTIAAAVVDFSLGKAGKVSYESRVWVDHTLVYKMLHIGEHIFAEKMELDFVFRRTPFYFEPHLTLTAPIFKIEEATLKDGKSQALPISLLLPSRFLALKLDIQEGLIEFQGDPAPLAFNFESGLAKEDIGMLNLYDASFSLTCQVAQRGSNLAIESDMQGAPLEKMLTFNRFGFSPLKQEWSQEFSKEWNEVTGVIEAHAAGELSSAFELKKLSANVALKDVVLTSVEKGVHFRAKETQASVNFPKGQSHDEPLWKQCEIIAAAKDAEILFYEPSVSRVIGLSECQGSFSSVPGEQPICLLNGEVLYQGASYPLTLEGKGVVHADAFFWMENECKIDTSAFKVAFSSPSQGSYVIQANLHHLEPTVVAMGIEAVSAFHSLPEELSFVKGTLSGQVTGWIKDREITSLQWENVQMSQVEWKGRVSLSHATSFGEIFKEKEWGVKDFTLQMENGTFVLPQGEVTHLNAHLTIQNDIFENSQIKGVFLNIPGEIQLAGPWHEVEASGHFSASISHWLQIPQEGRVEPDLFLDASCKKSCHGYVVTGSFTQEKEELRFGAEFDESISIRQGWFESGLLSSASYLPFLHCFNQTLQVEGNLALSGALMPDRIESTFVTDYLHFGAEKASGEVHERTEGVITFYPKENKITGIVPLKGVALKDEERGLSFEDVTARVVFTNREVHFEKASALCRGIKLVGQADLFFLENDETHFQVATESIRGPMRDLAHLSSKIASWKEEDLSGIFECGKNGFHLFMRQAEGKVSLDWRFKAQFQDLSLPLSQAVRLQKLSFLLEYDSSAQIGAFRNIQAELLGVSKNVYTLASPQLNFSELSRQCEFDFNLKKDAEEVLHVIGLAREVASKQYEFFMAHENNHFFSSRWEKLTFNLHEGTHLTTLEFAPTLKGQYLYSQAAFLSDLGLLSLELSFLESLKKLEGEIGARVQFSAPENFLFEAVSSNLKFDGEVIKEFELKGKKLGDQWILEKLHADDFFVRGSSDQNYCPEWEMRWKDIAVTGDAIFQDGITVQIENIVGLLPETYRLCGLGKSKFHLSPHPVLQDFKLVAFQGNTEVGRISTQQIAYNTQSKKWESPKVEFFGAPQLGQTPLSGFLSFKAAAQSFSFQGMIQKGSITLPGSSFSPKQFIGLYDQDALHLKCQGSLNEVPLRVQAKLAPKQGFAGTVTLQEDKKEEKVAVTFGPKLHCESVKGELSGLKLQLQRKTPAAPFIGHLSVHDGVQASRLFTHDYSLLKEVKRISLSGSWNGDAFEGELKGEEFEFKNHLFHEMTGTIAFDQEHAFLKNISLEDPAGSLMIKQITCEKRGEWQIDIPLLKGQNFRPCLLRKVGGETKEAKPLIIRNLVLSDIHAVVGHASTSLFSHMSGNGSLNFTNAFKKESSLFETPILMLKKLGLDLELFTPTSGEVSCELKDGKIFLTNMKNTYSEGRRSQFYIASDLGPSFIDFLGNVFVNIRMKQDVVLKFAEPFALTIRGTMDKPTYGLTR